MPDPPDSHDLPILQELGDDLTRAFRHEQVAAGSRRRSRPPVPAVLAHFRPRQLRSAASVALSTLVVLAIVAAAFTLHHHTAPSRAAPAVKPALSRSVEFAARQTLTAELGVLRQPQDAASRALIRHLALRLAPAGHGLRRRIILSSGRLIRLPGHAELLLYLSQLDDAGTYRSAATAPILGFSERSAGNGVGECCLSARELRQPSGPQNGSAYDSTLQSTVYFEIVPDGVAHVRWSFPHRSHFPPGVPARTFRPLKVTIAVHDNVAATRLPQRGQPIDVTWQAADGRVIATKHQQQAAIRGHPL
jgi:hypothetical protein